MKVEQVKQIASKAIEQLSQALEAGHSEKLREYLAAMARFHRYSLRNVMLIASQRPEATHVAGFQTWKQLGRFVKKGAKGILILAPTVLRKGIDLDNREEETERTAIHFRAVYIFDIADTDGKPLPDLGNAEGDPSDYTQRLKDSSQAVEFNSNTPTRSSGAGSMLSRQNRVAARSICRPKNLRRSRTKPAMHFFTAKSGAAKRRRPSARPRRKPWRSSSVKPIGLKAQSSADYIQLYSGSKETLAESLEHVQRASAEILAAVTQSD